jgi:hypothetical protein
MAIIGQCSSTVNLFMDCGISGVKRYLPFRVGQSVFKLSARAVSLGIILAGLFCLSASKLSAQYFLSDPANTYPGTSYLTSDTEFGGFFGVDGNFTTNGTLSIGGDVNIYEDDLYDPGNLTVTNLYTPGSDSIANSQTDYSLSGGLELWSGFSPGVPRVPGVGGSWFHASLDFGDLTYTGTATPAFNISQLSSGGEFYSTIIYTGYANNTTWVWQQNGLAAQADTGSTAWQMSLGGDGNLTIYYPGGSQHQKLSPENGTLVTTADSAGVGGTDAGSDQFSVITGNNAVVFSPSSGTPVSLTPASLSSLLASGVQPTILGSNITATGARSFAFGNNLSAAYYGSIVLGASNVVPSGVSSTSQTSWQAGDPLLVVGDGQDVDPLSILKSGNATLGGNITVSGNLTLNGPAAFYDAAFTGNVAMPEAQGDVPNAQ